MNKSAAVLLSLFVPLCSVPLAAQETLNNPPPKAPFAAVPPWGSTWSMWVEYDSSKKKEDIKDKQEAVAMTQPTDKNIPKQVDIRLGRNQVIQGTVTYQNGRQEDYYIAQGMLFQHYTNNGKVSISPAGGGDEDFESVDIATTPVLFRVSRFPGVKWLSLERYQETALLDKQPCYRYAMTVPGVEGFPDLRRQTWIKVEDGYPLKTQVNSTAFYFSPVTPFPQDIQLPAEYQKALKWQQIQLKALEARQRKKKP